MSPARVPKEMCWASIYEFTKKYVQHDWRNEEEGVLHRCVDRRERILEQSNGNKYICTMTFDLEKQHKLT